MNGAYTKVLRSNVWTVSCDNLSDDGKPNCSVIERKRVELVDDNQYHLVRSSKCNKASPDLVRSIFLLKDASGAIVNNTVLLQYYLLSGADKVELQVLPHGNRKTKSDAPFYPTARSTLDAMKKQLEQKPSAHVYRDVAKKVRGVAGAKTAGELPRSRKQVYDLRAKSKGERDPVDDLIVYLRHKEEKICLRHEDIPVDLFVLGTEVMCDDIGRFSCSDKLSHPISIDPTFNMGEYEVTPVVYKHLFLKTKRQEESPVFLGPTMIHHKKNFDTYKVLSSTCVSNCKGLSQAKGYMTDGEEALDRAWKTELPKATHLRCIRHFEGNCKQKLRDIGITEAKKQKFFLDEIFGVPGKVEGIVDLESKKEVKKQIKAVKEKFDQKESELLQRTSYKPRFYNYLYERRSMISNAMSQKARRKAGMPSGADGKRLRPYTNGSEAINNVMLQTKESFLREKKMPENSPLSKLQFTQHIFEAMHKKQQEELALAVIGLSDEYKLSEVAAHLAVNSEEWFEWSEEERKEYIKKFNSMSVEQAMEKKTISVKASAGTALPHDFQEFSVSVSMVLVEQLDYKEEIARAVEDGALMLLNSPAGIQNKATLQQGKPVKYEVASQWAKHGRVECKVNQRYVSCQCPSFKADRVCKHSIAVAEKSGIIEQHLKYVCNGGGQRKGCRTALSEAYVDKAVSGKKGSKNKYPYRPQRSNATANQSSGHLYTEIHHNDNPFVLQLLPEEAKFCKGCNNSFCHRVRILPHDLVLAHKERYFFPVDGDWKKKQATNKEATRYYHADPACLISRFPYFTNEYIQIHPDLKDLLTDSHKSYLENVFSLTI